MFWDYRKIFKEKIVEIGGLSILDVGCGDGSFLASLNLSSQYKVTGVELFDSYIEKAKSTGKYANIVKQNLLNLDFEDKTFDIVMCSQVVEHLKKEDSLKMISKMEKIARKAVIIGTPHGECHQDEYDGNDLQKHLSEWHIEDFKSMGYEVFGQGLYAVYGDRGLLKRVSKNAFFLNMLSGLSFVLSPITKAFPEISAHLIAVKNC